MKTVEKLKISKFVSSENDKKEETTEFLLVLIIQRQLFKKFFRSE